MEAAKTPQLLMYSCPICWLLIILTLLTSCGHGSIDDPDASQVYAETLTLLRERYATVASDVLVIRLGPSDQRQYPQRSISSMIKEKNPLIW